MEALMCKDQMLAGCVPEGAFAPDASNITATTLESFSGSTNQSRSVTFPYTGWYVFYVGGNASLRMDVDPYIGVANPNGVLAVSSLIYVSAGTHNVRYYGTSGSAEAYIKTVG